MKVQKTYLGDGAYAEFDGYGIWLTAENGIEATDRIYLEPSVYAALVAYNDLLVQRWTQSTQGRNDADEAKP